MRDGSYGDLRTSLHKAVGGGVADSRRDDGDSELVVDRRGFVNGEGW